MLRRVIKSARANLRHRAVPQILWKFSSFKVVGVMLLHMPWLFVEHHLDKYDRLYRSVDCLGTQGYQLCPENFVALCRHQRSCPAQSWW